MTARHTLLYALFALTLLFTGSASAEHEANHRFSVRGYVLDAAGQPIAGERVTLNLDGRTAASSHTNEDGFYVINLHIHDTEIGREMVLHAGDAVGRFRMRGEPGDKQTERLQWASFVGGEFREDAAGRIQIPGWAWVLVGVAGVVVVVFGGLRVQRVMARRRRRASAAAAPGTPAPATAKRRKSRKKRRS